MAARLIVVMPAYNEAACIEEVCREWLSVLDSLPESRLLVINDGSTDRTGEILAELARIQPALGVVHQANAGHGAAVLHGYRKALELGGAWVLQVDSDGQLDPRDLSRLWACTGEARFLLGCRMARCDPWLRRALSAALRLLIRILFGVRLRDPNVPFRLMEARYLAELLARLPEGVFAPNVLLAILAARRGADFREVPVSHRPRRAGPGSLRGLKFVRVLPRCLRELLAFWSKEVLHAGKT